MTNKIFLTASHIRYLIALKKLNSAYGIKSADIARELELTKPSIHNMMKTFMLMEYIQKKPGGRIFLTEHGLNKAEFFENYYFRIRDVLFLNESIDDTAERAICAFLAELSEENLQILGKRI